MGTRSGTRAEFRQTSLAESLGDFRYNLAESLGDFRYNLAESLGDFRYDRKRVLATLRSEKLDSSYRCESPPDRA